METSSKIKVVVFGATSGVGLQTVIDLANDGYQVYGTGRDLGKIESSITRHPNIKFFAVDSAFDDSLATFFKEIGHVNHVVISLSGAKGGGSIKDLALVDLIEGFNAKLFNQLRTLKASLPYLSHDGSITLISAVSSKMAAPGTAGLAAINGAIDAMIKPLAAELAPIRINSVSPGVIDTAWWNFLPPEAKQATFEEYSEASLVGRVGKPSDISKTIKFLIENSFITGDKIVCDGGLRLKGRKYDPTLLGENKVSITTTTETTNNINKPTIK